jgi:hypothetical protein
MTNPTPLPGRDADKPSPLDSLSRLELKTAALSFLEKAALKHREARLWRSQYEATVAELEALKASRRLP